MYMTPEQAAERLSARYGITDTPLIGDVIAASEDLRDMSPFGSDVDIEEPPDSLLDWVALRAYELSRKDDPPVQSEGVGGAQITYTRPWKTQTERRMARLIGPYLKRRGRVL